MKFVIALCLFGAALSLPQRFVEDRLATILRSSNEPPTDGHFRYSFETDNGIVAENEGSPGTKGQSNIFGTFRLPTPDGSFVEVRFVADEFGYRPESAILPTPHPLPAHALEQIRIAEDQRARGIVFN